jgi:hypothetical protein
MMAAKKIAPPRISRGSASCRDSRGQLTREITLEPVAKVIAARRSAPPNNGHICAYMRVRFGASNPLA